MCVVLCLLITQQKFSSGIQFHSQSNNCVFWRRLNLHRDFNSSACDPLFSFSLLYFAFFFLICDFCFAFWLKEEYREEEKMRLRRRLLVYGLYQSERRENGLICANVVDFLAHKKKFENSDASKSNSMSLGDVFMHQIICRKPSSLSGGKKWKKKHSQQQQQHFFYTRTQMNVIFLLCSIEKMCESNKL